MNALTIADSGSWSIGVLVGAPVAVVLIAAAVIGAIKVNAYRHGPNCESWDKGPARALTIGLAVAALGIAGVAIGAFYPYSAEYHQWREVSGTVQQIDKRLIGDGSSMEDKFVVRFAGDGGQFGCDDTRCASVREGDDLTLSCKRAWQYTGTDGYDCRFVATEAAR